MIPILTSKGKAIEVRNYKYMHFLIDHDLSFKAYVAKLVTKLGMKLGFYYRNKPCTLLRVRKIFVSATFLPLLDYGDVRVLQQNVYNL